MWFVYLIETKKGIYTGITTNLIRRYYQHSGLLTGGAKYFRGNPPLELINFEIFPDRSSAQKREYQIKNLKRKDKLNLARLRKI